MKNDVDIKTILLLNNNRRLSVKKQAVLEDLTMMVEVATKDYISVIVAVF